jgi:putative ABC transport system substrate-binding protein
VNTSLQEGHTQTISLGAGGVSPNPTTLVVNGSTLGQSCAAFALMVRERAGAFLEVASPLFIARRVPLAELARKHRLPGMYGSKENVQAGGLINYGADLTDLNRRAAAYIDKILKGAKPAELPVEQASKYKMVINQKTAKAIGLAIPESSSPARTR